MNFAKHIVAASLLSGLVFNANADVITDWNIKAGEIVTESKLGTPPAIRAMAIVQTAVLDAVNSVLHFEPERQRCDAQLDERR